MPLQLVHVNYSQGLNAGWEQDQVEQLMRAPRLGDAVCSRLYNAAEAGAGAGPSSAPSGEGAAGSGDSGSRRAALAGAAAARMSAAVYSARHMLRHGGPDRRASCEAAATDAHPGLGRGHRGCAAHDRLACATGGLPRCSPGVAPPLLTRGSALWVWASSSQLGLPAIP